MGNPKIGEYAKRAGTYFGGPNGNKPNGGGVKGGGKTFRQMIAELMFMDVDELKDYAADKKNPAVVRKAAGTLSNISSVKELAMAADMIESKPVQLIDQRMVTNEMTQEEFLSNVERAAKNANEV
jgi:hypothetical protein